MHNCIEASHGVNTVGVTLVLILFALCFGAAILFMATERY